jgi:mannose-6-phosphate isomerase-like protein (cupin superfamily)
MPLYESIIVRKPWGYEYLMYQNSHIGLWCLHIDKNCKTSLHCHPGKKTGFILISGQTRVSFLNGSVEFKAPSKLMIRQGLFHSTTALSEGGAVVLEVESPPDKTNLVRLDDEYGRKEQPYEGSEAESPLLDHCVILEEPVSSTPRHYNLMGAELEVESMEDIGRLQQRSPEEIILLLDGGLVSKEKEPIVGPGDVVTVATFNLLAKTFTAPDGVALLIVRTRMGEGGQANEVN